jgi:uridylate kinase
VPEAKRFERMGYMDVLAEDLRVMDASAVTLMRDNAIPIIVFSIQEPGTLSALLRGAPVGTVITDA